MRKEITFADHQDGEERTERCGKAGQITGECRAERQHQNGEQKEIGRVRSGNPGEPCPKNRLADEGSDAECDRRCSKLAQRSQRSRPAAELPSAEQTEKWKDSEILEQQDSE